MLLNVHMPEQGKSVRRYIREKLLWHSPPFPWSTCVGRGRGVGMMKLSLGKILKVLLFFLSSFLTTRSYFNNKLNQYPPSQICFFPQWILIRCLSCPMSFSVLFSPNVLLRRANENYWWASGTWMRSSHHNTTYFAKILGHEIKRLYRQPKILRNISNIIITFL